MSYRLDKFIYYIILLALFIPPLFGYQNEFLWSKVSALNFLLSIAVFIAIFISCKKDDSLPVHSLLFLYPLTALILFALLSCFFVAENKPQAISRLVVLFENIPLYILLILFVGSKEKAEKILRYMTLSILMVSIYGLMQYFEVVRIPVEFYGDKDPASTFFRTNQTGHLFSAFLPYLFAYLIYEFFYSKDSSIFKKVCLSLAVAIITYYFLIIRVRAAVIGVGIAIVFAIVSFFLRDKVKIRFNKNTLIYSSIVSFFTGAVYIFYLKGILLSLNFKDPPIIFRMLTWRSTWRMIKDNILFGVGAGNYENIFPKYQLPELEVMQLQEGGRVTLAHNDVLHIVSEYGIIGGAIFLWIAYYIAAIMFRAIRETKEKGEIIRILGVSGGIIATLINSLFCYNLQFPVPLAMLVLLISVLELHVRGKAQSLPSNVVIGGDRSRDTKFGRLYILLCLCTFLPFNIYAANYAWKRASSEVLLSDARHIVKNLSVKEAINYATRSIDLYPYNDMAYSLRGVAYSKLGEFDLALSDISKGIELYPYDGRKYNELGSVYAKMKDDEKAKEAFLKAKTLTSGLNKDHISQTK